MESGMLYLVATPIGNLKDITLRAIEVLKSVDVIACEDTRHSMILLNNYDIHSKLISYHKFNETNSAEGIIKLLKEGKNVAVISDAGMPVISDPGNILVRRLIEEELNYTVIAGVNAGLSAIVLSGFDSSKFAFWGFLSENKKDRISTINEIKNFNGSSIIYSSKYNINDDLNDLKNFLDSNRRVCVCNEISKMYEKVLFFKLFDAKIIQPKGEFVIVLDKPDEIKENITDEQIIDLINERVSLGEKKLDIIKDLSKKFGKSRNYIYDLVKGD